MASNKEFEGHLKWCGKCIHAGGKCSSRTYWLSILSHCRFYLHGNVSSFINFLKNSQWKVKAAVYAF